MNDFYKRTFLILSAHPDDAEIACGGLIQKIINNGGKVCNYIMVQPSEEINKKRNKNIIKKELQNSQKVLNYELKIFNTPLHKNGRPKLVLDNNLITEIEKETAGFDVLITHWREDSHQEHKTCYEIGKIISRKTFKEFWCMDSVPYNLHHRNFDVNLYIDITESVNVKIKALKCYSSYFNTESIEQIINYNKYRGSFIGKNKVAETFSIQYQKVS
jgi:LmbE family N-acetylglucosaminyl deacetylase